MIRDIIESIRENPVIPAVRREEDIQEAVLSEALTIFILNGDIFNISKMVDSIKESGKNVFIHIDFLEGLGRDDRAIDYIAEKVKPTGIISTRSSSIKYAKKIGVFTIQRFFLIDSHSYETTVKTIHTIGPDIVEIMPAVMPAVISRICQEISVPVIAGGMIQTKEEIIEILKSGSIAASTGKKSLWNL
ncbi:MAG: glycerol-3-phosphate responsive antiterminator [Clostridiaceae bacterium]|jgi:glycerol uptake operon antiterminator|nr:glycerol-3-phosphate responsive antiterminator [Clostridiaceae bacterium]